MIEHPVKVRRLTLGWSLDKLSVEAGISTTELSRIETCKRRLRVWHLRKLAAALGCGQEELVPTEEQERAITEQRRVAALVRRGIRPFTEGESSA